MAHIDSDGLSLEEFYNLEFRDEELKKKKKKHKNKKKDKKCKSYKKSKKNKKYYKKHSVVNRILDAVDVNLDSEIKISITDETINNAINRGIDLVRFLRNRKKNNNNNLEQPKEVPVISQSSNIDNND